MARKSIIKGTLLDWKHWVGWVFTVGAIVFLFYLLGVQEVYTPLYRVGLLTLVVVLVDVIKHAIGLQ